MSQRLKVQRAIDHSRRLRQRSVNRSQSISRTLASTDLDVGRGQGVAHASVFSRTSFIPTGHHVNAIPRLDREPVKAVSPEWGRSEAESLDRVEASRRIGVVMAGVLRPVDRSLSVCPLPNRLLDQFVRGVSIGLS